MRFPRFRPAFSLKTLLFAVTIVALVAYQFRMNRAAKRRTDIVAQLANSGCVVALGCQVPRGTAPPSADQEVVYVNLGGYGRYNLFQPNMLSGFGVAARPSTGEDAVDLSVLPHLKELRILDLGNRNLTTDDLRMIGRLPNLEILAAENTAGVTDDGLRQLAGLIYLRSLKIPNSQVTDEGLEALVDLVSLEDLNLHGAKVAGDGLRHLANLKQLRRLSLSDTQVGDAAIAYLRGLSSLEELTLFNTKITDKGVAQLRALKKLKYLDVSRTTVSLEAMESLRQSAPQRLRVMR
jgi:hypothetical protein